MMEGIVTGAVWSSKKADGLTGLILLAVESGSSRLIAADLVGAGLGERVLVCCGAAARLAAGQVPVDAAIVAILDQTEARHVTQ